jgi:hypothetical protein
VLAQSQKEKNLIDVFFIEQDHELLGRRQKPPRYQNFTADFFAIINILKY